MIQLSVPVILPPDRQFHTTVDLQGLVGTDVTGFSGYTVVTKLQRPINQVGGSRVRLVIRAPNDANSSVSAVYLGEAATSGHAWSFSSAATQVTFSGQAGLTLAAKGVFMSDPVVFDFNPAVAHLVAMNVTSSSLRRLTASDTSVISFYKAATAEAGTTTKSSGYTSQASTSYGLVLIQAARTPDSYYNAPANH